MISLDSHKQIRLPFLTPSKLPAISAALGEEGRHVMPHQLALEAELDYDEASQLLMALDLVGVIQLYLLIYHNCYEAPVDRKRFADGFPELPFECKHCCEEIHAYAELDYDLEAVINEAIKIY